MAIGPRPTTSVLRCAAGRVAPTKPLLKFLGFPIDGSVNEYASKLKSKGFYVSPDNKYASMGLRVMEGPFLGNIEQFGLHYDSDTKRMWSVTFVHSFFKEDDAKEMYDELEALLREKHYDATYKSPLSGSFVSSCSFQSKKGIITLVVIEQDYDYASLPWWHLFKNLSLITSGISLFLVLVILGIGKYSSSVRK